MLHCFFKRLFFVLSVTLLTSLPATAQEPDTNTQPPSLLDVLNNVRLQAETIAEQASATERSAIDLSTRAKITLYGDRVIQPGDFERINATSQEADRLATLARQQLDLSAKLFKEASQLSDEAIVAARSGKDDADPSKADKTLQDIQARAIELLKSVSDLASEAAKASLQITELSNTFSNARLTAGDIKIIKGKWQDDGSLLSTETSGGHVFANYDTNHWSGLPSQQANSIGCIDDATCTPVSIFFGTDRAAQKGVSRLFFTAARNDKLTLGKAIVTVPKAHRHKGDVNRPSWWDLLQYKNPWREDATIHFTIPDGGVTVYSGEDEFVAAAKAHMQSGVGFKDHVFVFVHGFNTEFDDALYRAAQITFDLGNGDVPFGTAFLYSWPSSGGVEHYADDFDSARLAVPHFKKFLQLVMDQSGAKHIHLIAHSMGNWPLVTVLNQLAAESADQSKVDQIILAAPDIDAGEFAKIADKINTIAKGVTLYASSNDRAMYASRKAHGEKWRAGDVSPVGPVIVAGIESVDVSVLNTDWLSLNHSTYAASRELLNDIWLLMREAKHPPDNRNNNFQPRIRTGLTYWQYAQ